MTVSDRASILLVDDQPANLLALEGMLGTLGQTLVKAHSGEEALRLLLDREVAVILLDVNMPGMDGFETARLIRARDKTRHVPLIFITAHDRDSKNVLTAYELGAVDFMFKPVEAEILRSKVSVFVELDQARRRERVLEREQAQVKELQAELERYRSAVAPSSVLPVGEALYGSLPLRTAAPEAFASLCERYARMLEQSLEGQVLKVDHHVTDQLRQLSDEMGFLRARPRDVIDLHQEAIAAGTKDVPSRKAKALVEEGRFLVLELMGNLVSFYRKHYPGPARVRDEKENTEPPANGAGEPEGGRK